MSKAPILVSVIIPVLNRANIIVNTLESVLAQSYKNWECVIVDDGSIDGTKDVIQKYVNEDSRIKLFSRPNHYKPGGNGARNFGFNKSKGEFVNWLDSDDILDPDCLKLKVEAFDTKTDAVLCRLRYANYHLTLFRESKFNYQNSSKLFISHALHQIELQTVSFMWRRSYLETKELFDESFLRFQDSDFHLRMLFYSPNIVILNNELAIIRAGDGHSSQISSKSNLSIEKLANIFSYQASIDRLFKRYSYQDYLEQGELIPKRALWCFYDALKFLDKRSLKLDLVREYKSDLKELILNDVFSSGFRKFRTVVYLAFQVIK